jgi:hypothetical protein
MTATIDRTRTDADLLPSLALLPPGAAPVLNLLAHTDPLSIIEVGSWFRNAVIPSRAIARPVEHLTCVYCGCDYLLLVGGDLTVCESCRMERRI